jgi:hypothetical protein
MLLFLFIWGWCFPKILWKMRAEMSKKFRRLCETANLHELKPFFAAEAKKVGGLVARKNLLLREEFAMRP